MSALCVMALVSGLTWSMPGQTITVVWEHSVEHTEWRETWSLDPGRMTLVEARIKGSGAGMEPGPGAIFKDGWWVWRPLPPIESEYLNLTRSGYVKDYELCVDRTCRDLGLWLPGILPRENVQLRSC